MGMRGWIIGAGMALAVAGGAVWATGLTGAQVVVLGEVHDNPHHHARQAALVAEVKPAALVFEMLTPEQAARVTPALRGDAAALEQALQWQDGGWPDFAMYYPIFAAVPEAAIHGAAVPRAAARAAVKQGVAESFGPEAGAYGLNLPLAKGDQAEREAFQHAAHCEALPEEMLPVMVELQRLRDATLAQATLRALDETGGPVVVITGNGHARRDWGMPADLGRVRPGLTVFSLGQSEAGGEADGVFDRVEQSPGVEREDPCAVFAKD
jgi:uncharacterized iron-regulated protein